MAQDAKPRTAAPASVVDEVVARIRALISERGLGIGDSLPTERQLCESFGASRNTVREAMRILKAYGLVQVRTRVGATITDNRMSSALEMFSFNVREMSRKTFEDIQGFRCLIEVLSVDDLFDRITPGDLAELRGMNRRLLDTGPLEQRAEHDFAFHARLIAVLDNRAILDVFGLMKPVVLRIMRTGKSRRTYEAETYHEHEAVLDAIEAFDRFAYQYLMRSHLNAGYAHFHEAMGNGASTVDRNLSHK